MSAKDKLQNGCAIAFFIIFGLSFLAMIAIGDSKNTPLPIVLIIAAIFGICLLVAVLWMKKNTPKN